MEHQSHVPFRIVAVSSRPYTTVDVIYWDYFVIVFIFLRLDEIHLFSQVIADNTLAANENNNKKKKKNLKKQYLFNKRDNL